MKTKSTVGRLLTHLSEWRESGARVAGTDTGKDTATDTAAERAQETLKRRSTYAARVAAMLLLLCTTAIPAWAEDWARTWNKMITDDGGGEVRFRGHNYNSIGFNWNYALYEFKTNKTFNPANDQF